MAKDRIYEYPLERVGDFVFDEDVVSVFPDMISRSVPGYSSILAMTVEMSEEFATARTNIYDLGCSLGAVTLPMARRVPRDAQIYAIDSSNAMVSQLKANVASLPSDTCAVNVVEADIWDTNLENASFVVMNFTMQFITAERRQELVDRIYEALLPGGAFVLSEKISFASANEQELMTNLHHAFKRANGYSSLEIAQKRTALENIMVPESLESHHDRMRISGFATTSTWFRCLNFASMIAIKDR